MAKADFRRVLAAPVLGGGLVLAGCSSSGSGSQATATTTSLPALSASPSTVQLFLKTSAQGLFGPDGKPGDPNQPPAVGDYFTEADIVYSGTHSSHPATSIGSAHLLCTVVAVSGNSGSGVCDGVIDLGGSMLVADHQTIDLSGSSVKLAITGGTGRYRGAQGTLSSADVGNSNDSDVTLRLSRPSGKAGSTPADTGAPALSASSQSVHYYSVAAENLQFGPDGRAITDPNAAPAVGDYFVSSNEDYSGNHTTHGKTVVATDHLICVLTQFSATSQTATAVCDGALAFGNSMLLAEHQSVDLSNQQGVSVAITGGTGRYEGAHGSVASNSVGNSDNSDITITLSK